MPLFILPSFLRPVFVKKINSGAIYSQQSQTGICKTYFYFWKISIFGVFFVHPRLCGLLHTSKIWELVEHFNIVEKGKGIIFVKLQP